MFTAPPLRVPRSPGSFPSRGQWPAIVTLALAVGLGGLAADSGPTFWTVATARDLLGGTSDGTYIQLNGVLTAGPRLTNRLTSTPAQVWSLLTQPDGSTWAGTGGDGRVIRLRPGQDEQTVFDSEETNVFALAASGTRVYAATSPDGRVYVIDGATPARPFFDPEEKYIWALAVDQEGRLWVGAGNPAVIYRVDAGGTGQALYRPPATHVVTLARDASGRMLAGTETPGRLYRFDAADRPFVLLDSGLAEVRAVTQAADGVLFAAAVSSGESGSGGEASSIAATLGAAASTTKPSDSTSTASTGSASASTPSGRSQLFRIEANGTWEAIWNSSDVVYDVAAQSDGSVLVATGPEGRLFKIDRTRDVSLLTGVDAKQVTRFATATPANTLVGFATANPGRVVAVGSGVQSPATYLSSVRDTKSVSTWGLIRWDATGPVSLYSRSGNTATPDDSWSEWAGPYTSSEGAAVTSPAARFVQWRAVFTTAGSAKPAALTSVTLAYLARNSRPVVSAITVHPPGVVFQRPFANDEGAIAGLDDQIANARRPPGDSGPTPPAPTRRMFQKGLQTITWNGEDDDSDTLSYTLQYRREGDTAWRDLREGVAAEIFVWDTTTVADGRYQVRILASDRLSNAADRALTGDRESDAVEIDNTPPTLSFEITRTGGAGRLVVRARDARSPIHKVEYSLDGGPWQLVYPVDGLADAPEERYEVPLPTDADTRRIVVRATDRLQNVMSQPAAQQ
jgi:hypothetical protein